MYGIFNKNLLSGISRSTISAVVGASRQGVQSAGLTQQQEAIKNDPVALKQAQEEATEEYLRDLVNQQGAVASDEVLKKVGQRWATASEISVPEFENLPSTGESGFVNGAAVVPPGVKAVVGENPDVPEPEIALLTNFDKIGQQADLLSEGLNLLGKGALGAAQSKIQSDIENVKETVARVTSGATTATSNLFNDLKNTTTNIIQKLTPDPFRVSAAAPQVATPQPSPAQVSVQNSNYAETYNFGTSTFKSGDATSNEQAIVNAMNTSGVTDPRQRAYILATAQFESDYFRTLEEYASGAAYEGRGDLGNTQAGDGQRYKGRGFVQLTGRTSYQKYSNILGVDLINNPQLLQEDPNLSAFVLVDGIMNGTYTGLGLSDFGAGLDFYEARRTVNGYDRAGDVAALAEQYLQRGL